MSIIARVGNLVGTPELKTNDKGNRYCYARVAVSDSVRDANGNWKTGPTIFYNLSVSGHQASQLVDAAQRCGNIRVLFSGNYRVSEYNKRDGGTGISHDVRVDELGVSFRGQNITVTKGAPATTVSNQDSTEATGHPWLEDEYEDAPF